MMVDFMLVALAIALVGVVGLVLLTDPADDDEFE